MKTIIALLAAAVFVAVLAGPAHAASFHCQNREFVISPGVVVANNGRAVAPELAYDGSNYGMLRAQAPNWAGSSAKFTMVCLSDQEFAIRASNGRYVSAEIGFAGADNGMLRARATAIGAWEKFRFESIDGITNYGYQGAFKSVANNKYVTVEIGYPQTDSRYAMLRAGSTQFNSWARVYLYWWGSGVGPIQLGVPVGGPCFDTPWMTDATLMWYWPPTGTAPPGELALEVSFTPTTAARLVGRNPFQWDDIWEDVKDCVAIPAFPRESVHSSLYKQLACHAVFGIHEELGGPTWDLESHRPDIPWEDALDPTVNEKCNWSGGGSSSSLIGSLIFRPSLDRFLNGPFYHSQLQPTPSGRRFGQPEIEFQSSGHILLPFARSRLSWRVPPRGLPSFAFSSPATQSFNDDHVGAVK